MDVTFSTSNNTADNSAIIDLKYLRAKYLLAAAISLVPALAFLAYLAPSFWEEHQVARATVQCVDGSWTNVQLFSRRHKFLTPLIAPARLEVQIGVARLELSDGEYTTEGTFVFFPNQRLLAFPQCFEGGRIGWLIVSEKGESPRRYETLPSWQPSEVPWIYSD